MGEIQNGGEGAKVTRFSNWSSPWQPCCWKRQVTHRKLTKTTVKGNFRRKERRGRNKGNRGEKKDQADKSVRELPADRGSDQGPAVCLHWLAVLPAIALGNERTPRSTVNSLLVQRPLHTALTRWSLWACTKTTGPNGKCALCVCCPRVRIECCVTPARIDTVQTRV